MSPCWRTDALTVPAAATLGPSPVHTHGGIAYLRSADDAPRHLHLAWHHDLRDDEALPVHTGWVEPALSAAALDDLAFAAELVSRRAENQSVPYGLALERAHVDDRGVVTLEGEAGLTCATFVLIVLAKAGIPLLDRPTWDTDPDDARRAEDRAHQERLVKHLRRTRGAEAHAERVANEVPCTRFRAEEVAAATALTPHPVPYASAETAGRTLLQFVQ